MDLGSLPSLLFFLFGHLLHSMVHYSVFLFLFLLQFYFLNSNTYKETNTYYYNVRQLECFPHILKIAISYVLCLSLINNPESINFSWAIKIFLPSKYLYICNFSVPDFHSLPPPFTFLFFVYFLYSFSLLSPHLFTVAQWGKKKKQAEHL